MSGNAAERAAGEAAAAVAELRILVHRLADEVAAFRRRAIAAETRVRELEEVQAALERPAAAPVPDATGDAAGGPPDPARVAELERENADLRGRLAQAAERTRQLLDRARFLRQQQEESSS
ncbi:MAG TPA: hypothetical protein VFS08_20460 [Gemmatimonadaceae bacterium]|nr:hypothetical protein [Gemmatimonadaceae bacterium]